MKSDYGVIDLGFDVEEFLRCLGDEDREDLFQIILNFLDDRGLLDEK